MTASDVATVYAVFGVVAIGACRALGPARAVVPLYLAGWLLLPVALYPPPARVDGLRIEIIGLVVPSNLAFAKAALIPSVVGLASLATDWRRWRGWRPGMIDLPVLCFCVWPLRSGTADAGAQGLYLLAAWGGSWTIGRLYAADAAGRARLLRALAWSGLALLPIAVIEGGWGPRAYPALYGYHPFLTDGIERYLGFRPLALFEDGNQYGIWVAMAALAAVALARDDRRFRPLAVATIVIAMASQSVGAIALLLVGSIALTVRYPLRAPRWVLPVVAASIIAAATIYLSGLLPIDRLGRQTPVGQAVIAALRRVGRGSLMWRVSQDQKVLPLILQHPLVGHGRWDWWMPAGARPWGTPVLVIGQYGAVGLALACLAWLLTPIRLLVTGRPTAGAVALAIVAVAAAIDACLNSFVYFPALLIAGGLAARPLPESGHHA